MTQIASADAAAFLFAGKATFTLVSKASSAHFTYRIAPSNDGQLFFASVVQNGAKLYAGVIPANNRSTFRTTRAAKVQSSHPAVRALEWFLKNTDSEQVELHHCGKCGRCGRRLTHPHSLVTGLGPECAEKLGEHYGPVRGAIAGQRLQHLKPAPVAEHAPESQFTG